MSHTPQKIANVSAPVLDVIAERWSPRAFENRAVEPEKLRSLFEAARWAASANNAQPWSFIVATKDNHADHRRIVDCLVEGNQPWASEAPVLAISIARLHHENGNPNRHALHDVGQAAAQLALQAVALGLQIHQMAGILPEKIRHEFAVPEGYEAVAGIAIGYPGDPGTLPERFREREIAPRTRKHLETYVFGAKFGEKSPLVVHE